MLSAVDGNFRLKASRDLADGQCPACGCHPDSGHQASCVGAAMLIDHVIGAKVLPGFLRQVKTQEVSGTGRKVRGLLQHGHARGTATKSAAVTGRCVCFDSVYDLVGVDGVCALRSCGLWILLGLSLARILRHLGDSLVIKSFGFTIVEAGGASIRGFYHVTLADTCRL